MKNLASTTAHWKSPTTLQGVALLLLMVCAPGQSLHISPNFTELQAANGGTTTIQCIVDDDIINHSSFVWSQPTLSSGTERNTSITYNISGTVSTLTINNVSSYDAGQYNCSYADHQVSITLVVVENPGFLSVQRHQKFAERTEAVVLCPAYYGTNPQNVINMQWTRNNRAVSNLGDRFIAEDGKLRIKNIQNADSGDYQCLLLRGTYAVIDSRTIQVEVLPHSEFAPKINDSVPVINVTYGEPLNLPCQLEKTRYNVAYSWIIDTKFEHDILKNTRANLHIEAGKFAGGKYTCIAENEYGADEVDFIVKIEAPPLPTQCTMVMQVVPDTTVILKYCDLTSPVQASVLTFNWIRNGTTIAINSGGRFSVNQFGLLTIKNITPSDLGSYQVAISNAKGTAVHTIKLENASCDPAARSRVGSQRFQKLLDKTKVVPIFLKFTVTHGGAVSCTTIQEETQGFIHRQILKEFDFYDVVVEGVTIECPSIESKRFSRTFRVAATLKGNRARQLGDLIKSKGILPFTLNNGRTITVKVCTKECSLEDSTTLKPWINKTSGVVIAVTVIAVMLAGVILLIVILVCYRRRSLAKSNIDEEQLYLAPPTNLENKFAKTKPPYYRSISVNLPITSQRSDNH